MSFFRAKFSTKCETLIRILSLTIGNDAQSNQSNFFRLPLSLPLDFPPTSHTLSRSCLVSCRHVDSFTPPLSPLLNPCAATLILVYATKPHQFTWYAPWWDD